MRFHLEIDAPAARCLALRVGRAGHVPVEALAAREAARV